MEYVVPVTNYVWPPLYFNFNLGASYIPATKSILLKFNAKYHNQFQDNIYEGISIITVNGISSQAKQNLTGDYFGFGVTIIPHKNVFR